jgi:glycosyltransferase 2 family protein
MKIKMPRNLRGIIACLQILFTIVLLSFLLRQVSVQQVFEVQSKFPLALIGAAAVSFIGCFLLATYNWYFLLSRLVPDVPFWRMLNANLSGLFYGSVLPSAISSDVVRGARLYQRDYQATALTTSIVIDRLTGLIAFVLIFIAASPSYYRRLPTEITSFLDDYALYLLLVGVGGLIVLGFALRLWIAKQIVQKFHLAEIKWHTVVTSVFITCWVHVGYALMLWFLSLPFVDEPDFLYYLFVTEVVLLAEFLPISVGGLGVREGIYVVMLEQVGIQAAEAIAISLMQFFIIFAVSLIGGIQELTQVSTHFLSDKP